MGIYNEDCDQCCKSPENHINLNLKKTKAFPEKREV